MRFSLFGFPVHVQPIFWLVAVMLGMPNSMAPRELMRSVIWVAVVFVSILIHELGHAFAMRAYGRTPSIELWGLGGLTSWGSGPAVTPGKDIVVSLAGPFAGFGAGLVVFAVALAVRPAEGSIGSLIVADALWVNVGWGLVNLLPILPLDGGHVLESTAAWIAGPRGRRAAYIISLVFAIAGVAFMLSRGQWWIAFLGLWCASASWRALQSGPVTMGEKPAETKLPKELVQALEDVWSELSGGNPEGAAAKCEALLATLPAEATRERAEVLEALAWVKLEMGDEAGAVEAGRRMPGRPSDVLSARLAIAEGRLAEGIRSLERVYERNRESFPAMVLSAVYIEQERPDLSLGLLKGERGAKNSARAHARIGAQLFGSEAFEESFEAHKLAFERFGVGVFAYNAACSLARLGRVDEGIEWLERALEAGFDEASQLDGDDDIAALRADPRFASLRAKLSG